MKVRTITIGIPGVPRLDDIKSGAILAKDLKRRLLGSDFEVQTCRLALGHWDSGLEALGHTARNELLSAVSAVVAEEGVDFCSTGLARGVEVAEDIVELLATYSNLTACVDASDLGSRGPSMRCSAAIIRALSQHTVRGEGNFRFAAGFGISPNTPYFPAAFHSGPTFGVSLGLENSDALVKAFTAASLSDAVERLTSLLAGVYARLEALARQWSRENGVHYVGIDTSIAPSLNGGESVVDAFDALGLFFGRSGTLALFSAITGALQQLPVERVGFCGIMLPVLEDPGLAAIAAEGRLTLEKLLVYSSVCGIGLDMLPLPGTTSEEELTNVLSDVAAMSSRLKKPLVARLLPVPGKSAGQMATFGSPYMCDAPVFDL